MILTGEEIKELGIMNPCREKFKKNGVSGGLSICSYDVTLDQFVSIPAKGFALASTSEEFNMPLHVAGIVHDKSTWARIGIAVQNTFIDPGWKGYLTLEISNNTDKELHFTPGTPIAQIVFHHLTNPVVKGYEGKYQNQERGIVPGRLEE